MTNLSFWEKYGRTIKIGVTGIVVFGGLGLVNYLLENPIQRKVEEILHRDKKQVEEIYSKRVTQLDSLKNLALKKAKADSLAAWKADSLTNVALAKARADSIDSEKAKEATKAAIAQVQLTELNRVKDYIKIAQRINSDFKAGPDKTGKKIIFQYYTVDKSGNLNFSQRTRTETVRSPYFAVPDSLEDNVARLAYIKALVTGSKQKIEEWYKQFVNGEFDLCLQAYGKDAELIFNREVLAYNIDNFNEGTEYILKGNKGKFTGAYRTVRGESGKPDYTETEKQTKQQFRIKLGDSQESRERIEKLGKARNALDKK